MRSILTLGALALATGGVVWSVRHAQVAAKLKNDRLDERMATLEAQVSASPRVLRVASPPIAPAELPSVQASPAPGGSAEAEPERVPAEDFSESNRRLWQAMTDDFESEPIDSGWARAARSEYLGPIQKALPATSELVSFECRSKFCRAEVVHKEIEAHNPFMEALFSLQGQESLIHVSGGCRVAGPVPVADGRYKVEIYVAGRDVSLAVAETE